MIFPETVKSTLWDIIDEISLAPSSFVKNPNKDLVRRRKKEFNSRFPPDKFRGKYDLIACDGSEFNIAGNPGDTDTFHEPGTKSASGFNMVHTISLSAGASKLLFGT